MPKIFPDNIQQNPFPLREDGQEYGSILNRNVALTMEEIKVLLPDNYKSVVNGPSFMQQLQTIATELCKIQIAIQEIHGDIGYDTVRSEFLYKFVGDLVFPSKTFSEIPNISGDISYREFLKNMVGFVLAGSKKTTIEDSVSELVPGSDVEILERWLSMGFMDQFTFEINITTNGGISFPDTDPFILEKNISLMMRVLKPAHILYEYRHIFIDILNDTIDTQWVPGPVPGVDIEISGIMNTDLFLYEDNRVYCGGVKNIVSSSGYFLYNRSMFSDVAVSFDNIQDDYPVLVIDSGRNKGRYRVLESMVFPTSDVSPCMYTTTGGLSGTLTISGDIVEDLTQDFSTMVEGEVVTIISGPNIGSYRVKSFIGEYGCPIHQTPAGIVSSIMLSKCLLSLEKRAVVASSAPEIYTVEVDRLGIKETIVVTSEDVSSQFFL